MEQLLQTLGESLDTGGMGETGQENLAGPAGTGVPEMDEVIQVIKQSLICTKSSQDFALD